MEYVLIIIIVLAILGYSIYVKWGERKNEYKHSVLVAQNQQHIAHRNEVRKIIGNTTRLVTVNNSDVRRLVAENEAIRKDLNVAIMKLADLEIAEISKA